MTKHLKLPISHGNLLIPPRQAAAFALWRLRHEGIDVPNGTTFSWRQAHGQEPCCALCRRVSSRTVKQHVCSAIHIAGLFAGEAAQIRQLAALISQPVKRRFDKGLPLSMSLGLLVSLFAPEARSLAAAAMLEIMPVTPISQVNQRMSMVLDAPASIATSIRFWLLHAGGLQVLENIANAPKGCGENIITGWLMAFSIALNQVELLPQNAGATAQFVQTFNTWVCNTHRLLLNLQNRFPYVHQPNCEVLARLL